VLWLLVLGDTEVLMIISVGVVGSHGRDFS
jgi:hypothetical protein